MPLTRTRHRFSVDEYQQMIESGILSENDRVELIHGEIIEKMPIGPKHSGGVIKLTQTFSRILMDSVLISIQNPVVLADSEPEPDVTLLKPRDDYYASAKPTAADVLLLVEIADSSLDFDHDVKLPMYAQAGIREYWLINLDEDCLEVYRQPTAQGEYARIQTFRRGQSVELEAFPGLSIPVDQLI